MAQTATAQDFLMGGGVPSAKFPVIGASVTGTIAREPELQQQTDFDSGEPLTWPDGSPRMQARVVLLTKERDPQIVQDDGTRSLYIKGAMQKAVAAAVRAAGATRLEVGGTLTITYSGDGVAQGKKNPPKLFGAVYVPPNPLSLAADPDDEDRAPAGVDPAAWAKLPDSQKRTLRAALGTEAENPPF